MIIDDFKTTLLAQRGDVGEDAAQLGCLSSCCFNDLQHHLRFLFRLLQSSDLRCVDSYLACYNRYVCITVSKPGSGSDGLTFLLVTFIITC